MSEKALAVTQVVVVVVCITIIACVAMHHRYNGWLASLALAAVSGTGGYSLRGAVESAKRARTVLTDNK